MEFQLYNILLYIPIIICSIVFILSVYFIASWIRIKKFPRPKRSMKDCEQDVIVIGAGVVGTAAAVTFARQGRKVKVIEKDMKEPDRIIGELMQPGGIIALKQLGMLEATSDIDYHFIKGYIIHNNINNKQIHIPYPQLEDEGRAFHHGRFIMGMRRIMMQEKNIEVIEGNALSLITDNDVVVGVKTKIEGTKEIKNIFAPLTVVADGCFSKFRKDIGKLKPETKSHFVGMLMKDCPQYKSNHAELVMTDTSPVLIYRVSSDYTRVLVDIRDGLPKDLKGYLRDEVAPQMPDHLAEPFVDAIYNDRVRSMPNSFLPACPVEKAGVIAVGDAFNMRHPLTGGGMSVALNDMILWRDLLKDIPDFSDYESVLSAQRNLNLKRKNTHAFVINVLSFALYELFAANDPHLYRLKEACFSYFELGGSCVSGPVGLLSVLDPRPHILLGHFFAVALYAVWFCFKRHTYRIHSSIIQSSLIFYKACCIMFPLIWSEIQIFIT